MGSVRLLASSPPRRPRRLQLQRPLLLALRCLVLALVAWALAGPRLAGEARTAATPHPWVLVEPGLEGRLPEKAARAVASGAELRSLAAGPPLRGAVRGVARRSDPADVPGGTWSLLREAATLAPPGTRLIVVSRGRLAELRGPRPALAEAVEWLEVPDERANRWPARAVVAGANGELVVGTSDRRATTFEREAASPAEPIATVTSRDAVADDDRLPVTRVRPLRTLVAAAPDRAADERYLRAALAAAAEERGIPLRVEPSSPGEATLAALDDAPLALVFWLADASPPRRLLDAARAGALLLSDAGVPEEACEGTFVASPTAAPVAVRRCARARDGGALVWRTDTGRALLTAQPLGEGRWLHLAGRLHPAWSDLVLSPAFPAWLASILADAAGATATAERPGSDRRSSSGQGRPAVARGRAHAAATPPPSRLPEQLAWALLFPLFVAERWLALRREPAG